MGSFFNFKNMGDGTIPPEGNGGGRPPGNFSLTRQPSVYSLTLDEFQNSIGGIGKDFGSMNMDEFLKNIWTAEEAQAMGSSFGTTEGGVPGGNLQRQGSLTLPRTISQKTVDEVWRDLFIESGGGGNVNRGLSNLPQRQQTLGEITLEEFLVRAGVVREDAQSVGRPNNNGFYGELLRNNQNPGLSLGFEQLGQTQTDQVMANLVDERNNPHVVNQSPNLLINVNGVKPLHPQQQQQQPQQHHQQQQLQQRQHQHQQQPQPQQQQQLFTKQPTVAYTPPLHLANTHVASPGTRDVIMGIGDPTANNSLVQGGGPQGGGMGMVGVGVGAVTVAKESPVNHLSSDGLGRSNGNTSSFTPSPYAFTGGLRGKRYGGAVEKVFERRQKRMIKNRESAARSRARKQAYTVELEAEIAKLKEDNEELQKKQVEFREMQKIQVLAMINQQRGAKKRRLRRSQTGPW